MTASSLGGSPVNRYLEVLSGSVVTFTVTNIDDAFLLTLLFARRIPPRRVVAGQYLGFAVITIVSLMAAFAALAIPHRWIRLLGLLPLALGLWHLLRASRKQSEPGTGDFSIVSIALVTISNAGDNIGIYVPFFVLARAYLWEILATYALLIGVWCLVGKWLGNRSLTLRLVNRWADRAVPFVFVLLGIFLLSRR